MAGQTEQVRKTVSQKAGQKIAGPALKGRKGLLGRKVGMTQIFEADGTAVPVTVIEAGPCPVVVVRSVGPCLGLVLGSVCPCGPPLWFGLLGFLASPLPAGWCTAVSHLVFRSWEALPFCPSGVGRVPCEEW